MSIINEALKKAVREKETGYSSEDREAVRRHIELEFRPKKPRLNWGPIFVLLVLVLITGPIVAPIFSTPFKGANTTGAILNPAAAQNVPVASDHLANASATDPKNNQKAQFAIEESPLFNNVPAATIISRTPDLSLSGIVYSPKESYCIINNKIIKVGDTIQGARLLEVSQNSVKFDYQGKEMALSMGSE